MGQLSEETLGIRKALYPEYQGERNFRRFWEDEFNTLLDTVYNKEDYKDLFGRCKLIEDFEKDWKEYGIGGFYAYSKAYVFHTAAYNLSTSWGMDMMRLFCRTYLGGSLLDYGAGCGNFNILAGGETYVDLPGIFFDTARKRFEKRKIEVRMLEADNVFIIPIDTKFDYIICTEVLEHVEFAFALVHYLTTLLKDNGRLMLSYSFGTADKDVMHLAKYDKGAGKEIWRILRDNGLELILKDFKGHVKVFAKGLVF